MNQHNFLMAFLQANQAKKFLEERNSTVNKNFVLTQAMMGGALNNPAIHGFMLQNEVNKLDKSPATISSLTAEKEGLKESVEKANLKVSELTNQKKGLETAIGKLYSKYSRDVSFVKAFNEIFKNSGLEITVKNEQQSPATSKIASQPPKK